MLLRRFAQSLRRQDWPAVGLEFVIVVVGIFVGLQATEWNEQRQLRARELNYLERLREDVAGMRAEVAEILGDGSPRHEATLRTFRALEACDPELAGPDDIRVTLARYQNQRTAVVVDRTYQEMVASGALAAMSDQRLSAEIAVLFGALGNYKEFITGVRISLPVVDRVLWQHLDFSYNAQGAPVLRDFDFAAACRNRELRNAAWEIHDLVWDWEQATLRVADQLDAFLVALDGHLAG